MAGAILWLLSGMCPVIAQSPLDADAAARVDAAMKAAFATLYALPSDTDAVPLGEWVRDSERTTADIETGTWMIRITRLADTGQDLKLNEEMWRLGGTSSARQVEETTRAMERLEGRISKAEADATFEVVVKMNAPELAVQGLSNQARHTAAVIPGASIAVRIASGWMRIEDPELDIDHERWSPETLLIAFGPANPPTNRSGERDAGTTVTVRSRLAGASNGIGTIFIRAQGPGEMIDTLLKDTSWAALAALLN